MRRGQAEDTGTQGMGAEGRTFHQHPGERRSISLESPTKGVICSLHKHAVAANSTRATGQGTWWPCWLGQRQSRVCAGLSFDVCGVEPREQNSPSPGVSVCKLRTATATKLRTATATAQVCCERSDDGQCRAEHGRARSPRRSPSCSVSGARRLRGQRRAQRGSSALRGQRGRGRAHLRSSRGPRRRDSRGRASASAVSGHRLRLRFRPVGLPGGACSEPLPSLRGRARSGDSGCRPRSGWRSPGSGPRRRAHRGKHGRRLEASAARPAGGRGAPGSERADGDALTRTPARPEASQSSAHPGSLRGPAEPPRGRGRGGPAHRGYTGFPESRVCRVDTSRRRRRAFPEPREPRSVPDLAGTGRPARRAEVGRQPGDAPSSGLLRGPRRPASELFPQGRVGAAGAIASPCCAARVGGDAARGCPRRPSSPSVRP
ncbi:collagen alpha-2(I) chain-like [Lutra lutra]|uniref:collagen alpha-2(I) chain-like n=1 Tax=Lutra lutra TaxID=9657 RepID=UPI001FD5C2A3|nr:collagen alpha-2(I) chain-like [Lutra lutra]